MSTVLESGPKHEVMADESFNPIPEIPSATDLTEAKVDAIAPPVIPRMAFMKEELHSSRANPNLLISIEGPSKDNETEDQDVLRTLPRIPPLTIPSPRYGLVTPIHPQTKRSATLPTQTKIASLSVLSTKSESQPPSPLQTPSPLKSGSKTTSPFKSPSESQVSSRKGFESYLHQMDSRITATKSPHKKIQLWCAKTILDLCPCCVTKKMGCCCSEGSNCGFQERALADYNGRIKSVNRCAGCLAAPPCCLLAIASCGCSLRNENCCSSKPKLGRRVGSMESGDFRASSAEFRTPSMGKKTSSLNLRAPSLELSAPMTPRRLSIGATPPPSMRYPSFVAVPSAIPPVSSQDQIPARAPRAHSLEAPYMGPPVEQMG